MEQHKQPEAQFTPDTPEAGLDRRAADHIQQAQELLGNQFIIRVVSEGTASRRQIEIFRLIHQEVGELISKMENNTDAQGNAQYQAELARLKNFRQMTATSIAY